jgi:hypothetical protein
MEELTFGQLLVGLNFNPSNDPKVQKAKQLCAELADLVYNHNQDSKGLFPEHIIYSATLTDILKAQMMSVKLLTLNK